VSQPTRFSVRAVTFDDGTASVIHSSDVDGEYVLHADYARLKAEKEAETRATFDAIRTITELRDENERLTRLLLDLSNAVHIHRANANGSKCDAEINRIVAEVDTIFDIQ
jgi:hypothetical protein